MQNPRKQALPGPFTPRTSLNGLAALCLSLCAQLASGASIEGSATNGSGEPLHKVAVCLTETGVSGKCTKVQATDKKGNYSFSGLKPGIEYTVIINGDRSASGRRFESYTNYVWEPAAEAALMSSQKETVTLPDFVGKFNFSNFQRVVTLGAADFPELASIDLEGSYTALKVFIPSSQEGVPPQTIFLGRVTSATNVEIDASVPLSVAAIGYEIYSAVLSVSGSIALR